MRLIDADKLKRKCQKVATEAWKMKIKASAETIMNQFIDFIDETDTVDAVPVRHGRWKRKIVDCGFNADWVCSQCGHRVMTDFVNYKYCPSCGARMDGKDGEGGE